jgi:hypothetical protein
MSIEDIDYLIQNSDKNSLTVFVDSRKRDYAAYPTPASYVVNFDEPIKNIYGLEILDASLPVTEYTIDVHNNTLAFSIIFNTIGTTLTDFTEHFNLLQHCIYFNSLFLESASTNIFIVGNSTNYNNIVSQYSFNGNTSNMIILVLTFALQPNSANDSVIIDNIKYFVDRPIPPYDSIYIDKVNHQVVTFTSTYCTDIDALTLANTLTGNPLYDFFICNIYSEVAIGNYNSNTLRDYLNAHPINNVYCSPYLQNGIVVSWLDDVNPGSQSLTQMYTFSTNTDYAIVFDGQKGSLSGALGFSQSASDVLSSSYHILSHYSNNQLFMSRLNSSMHHVLTSPGLVNLENVRYIILRCPEIESHLLGSYSTCKYSPGIGLFKMTDTNSVSNLRFDFLNIVRTPFHPIGKLSRLTLRFENSDAVLYNFKSVDHVLLLSIKYYSPKSKPMSTKSTLNKNYNPNVLEYMLDKTSSIPNRPKNKNLDEILNEQTRFIKTLPSQGLN